MPHARTRSVPHHRVVAMVGSLRSGSAAGAVSGPAVELGGSAPIAEPMHAPSDPAPPRVLVVDDEPSVRELVAAQLVEHGMRVVGEAANGRDAIRLVSQLAPDVVVLDIAMPIMDGRDALPQIRELAPRARVVVLSGMDEDETRREVLEHGAHLYLSKSRPWDLGRFLSEALAEPGDEVLHAVLED